MAKVLVTGFIATHVINLLLKSGYSVLTTVRSEEKGHNLRSAHATDKLDFAVVPDISLNGAFDEVCKSEDLSAVLHVASPFHYNVQDPKEDLINPAILGTTRILRSIKDFCPSVKRVVVTSSFAAILDPKVGQSGATKIWSEKDWNPLTIDDAYTSPVSAYMVSKVMAEKAAWDFVEREQPGFTLTTMNPPMVYGPATQGLSSLSSINTSNQLMADLICGKFKEGMPPTGLPLWVDVRDLALAHIRALEFDLAASKRFFVTAGHYSNGNLLNIIRENFPELRRNLPQIDIDSAPKNLSSWGYDNSRATELLQLEWTSFEKMAVDTVKSLLSIANKTDR